MTIVDPEETSFTCVAEGLPRPTISWFYQQNDVTMETFNTSYFSIDVMNGIGDHQVMSTLTVTSVRPSLARRYICNATNVVSVDTEEASLVVHSK